MLDIIKHLMEMSVKRSITKPNLFGKQPCICEVCIQFPNSKLHCKQRDVVYVIKCSGKRESNECHIFYIGETSRSKYWWKIRRTRCKIQFTRGKEHLLETIPIVPRWRPPSYQAFFHFRSSWRCLVTTANREYQYEGKESSLEQKGRVGHKNIPRKRKDTSGSLHSW